MKTPNKKQILEHERNLKFNALYRSVESKLKRECTYEERVRVMSKIWPAVQNIASIVMRRTMDDVLKPTPTYGREYP